MRRTVYDIILHPIFTEKSEKLKKYNTYLFKVPKDVNAVQIKEAVEKIFKVKVEKVNIVKVKGHRKRVRFRYFAKLPDFKKAYVKLKEGTIDLASAR